jgi:hypothetical protein
MLGFKATNKEPCFISKDKNDADTRKACRPGLAKVFALHFKNNLEPAAVLIQVLLEKTIVCPDSESIWG